MKQKMTKQEQGTILETLVQEYYQSVLSFRDSNGQYRPVEVSHDISIKGKSGASHQIDVYWDFLLGNIRYKTVVEVKNWNHKVQERELLAFKAVLDDIPGNPQGVFISSGGFQSGAMQFASHHGIQLYTYAEEVVRKGIKVGFSRLHTSGVYLVGKSGTKYQPAENQQILLQDGRSILLDLYINDAEDQIFEQYADGHYDGIIEIEDGESVPLPGAIHFADTIEKIGFHMQKTTLPMLIDIKDFAKHIFTDVTSKEQTVYTRKPKVDFLMLAEQEES